MKIGIDKIGFYTPHLYLDMNQLAKSRGIEPEKFTIGIGQEKMAVPPVTQDPVTLGANAALEILSGDDKDKIDLVMFGTESGIDHSKSAGIYVHHLLGLKKEARNIELKQACYGATAAIQLAKGHIALNPESKVLIIASDIARYGLKTSGESTQGAGACVLLISAEPRLLELEEKSAYATSDIMDFWRPVYSEEAFVDGKFSNEQYIAFFQDVWKQYKEKTGLGLSDFEAICYHMPYTKMGLKALRTVLEEASEKDQERLLANYEISKTYNKNVGNIYTGSLYLSFLSLIEQQKDLQAGDRLGFYSYGSGAVGEFFTGILQPHFQDYLLVEQHEKILASRQEVSVSEYEKIFEETLPQDGSSIELDVYQDPAPICVAGIDNHMRQYVNKEA